MAYKIGDTVRATLYGQPATYRIEMVTRSGKCYLARSEGGRSRLLHHDSIEGRA